MAKLLVATFYELRKNASRTVYVKVNGKFYKSCKPVGVTQWAIQQRDKSLAWSMVNEAMIANEVLDEGAVSCLQSSWGKGKATNRSLIKMEGVIKKAVEDVTF